MKPYACHNREPFAQTMQVQDGWTSGGSHRIAHMREVPFRMNPDCQYTHTELGKADQRCAGCKHRGD